MFRRTLPTILLTLALIAAACGDDETANSTVTTGGTVVATTAPVADDTISTAEYLGFRAQATFCGADAPEPAHEMAFSQPEDLGLSGVVTAVITTSCGDVVIELDADTAPETVNSFVFLAEQGYFNGTVSHRVVSGFMIQAGDPTATGRGGPGYSIPDELPIEEGFVYSRGTLAMANAGPNTGGSQFFLVLVDVPLPPSFSVFGMVTSGLDVMDRIAGVPTVARAAGQEPSSPLETVYIESVTIQR
jgi:cyclophilin family peptidyl-prolyl cis-trans isomerase